MIRTQIQLPESLAEEVKARAARDHRSMADLVREAVAQYLTAPGPEVRDEARQRAVEAAGRFHSGRSDLSASHDEHFAEASEG